MIHKLLRWTMLMVGLCGLCAGQITTAQESGARLLYICVTPNALSVTPNALPAMPYLLVYRDSDVQDDEADAFGLIFPFDAAVTVYSPSPTQTIALLAAITTNAANGSYRQDRPIALSYTESGLSIPRPCSAEYAEYTGILNASLMTISNPMTPDHALFLQIGGSNLLQTVDVLGAFSLHLHPSSGQNFDFQFLQLTGGGFEMTFPFLTENTPFFVVANREFSVRRSFAVNTETFSERIIANERMIFEALLATRSINLYDLLATSASRIYPAYGVDSDVSVGGYMRLEMSPLAVERTFSLGDVVRPLPGAVANYYVRTNLEEPFGVLQSPENTAVVVEVNAQGQLLVTDPRGADPVILESWLVEVSP